MVSHRCPQSNPDVSRVQLPQSVWQGQWLTRRSSLLIGSFGGQLSRIQPLSDLLPPGSSWDRSYPSTKSKRPASDPAFLAVRTSNSLRNRPSERFRLAREIELGGEHAAGARLHLHMDMARAAGINAGHDAAQSITSFGISELMAAQAETGIVIPAFVVSLPELQQGSGEWFASAGEHEANQFDRLPRHAGFKQLDALGRRRLENGPSVCASVALSPSWHAGVGASGASRNAAIDREH